MLVDCGTWAVSGVSWQATAETRLVRGPYLAIGFFAVPNLAEICQVCMAKATNGNQIDEQDPF